MSAMTCRIKVHLKTQNAFTQVTVVVTKRSSDGIPAPTISIRAINPSTSNGLRKDTKLETACGGTEPNPSVEDCIKKNTFSQEDVLHDVIFGFRNKDLSLVNNKSFLINEDFSAFFLGRYYTFNLETKLNTLKGKTQHTSYLSQPSQPLVV